MAAPIGRSALGARDKARGMNSPALGITIVGGLILSQFAHALYHAGRLFGFDRCGCGCREGSTTSLIWA